MVKSVEKSLNRAKGARKVRFLRFPSLSQSSSPVPSSVKSSPTRGLSASEAALLLEEQDIHGIKQHVVENNRGSVSFRNSISFRDSLTLSLSLALSPNKSLDKDMSTSALKGIKETK